MLFGWQKHLGLAPKAIDIAEPILQPKALFMLRRYRISCSTMFAIVGFIAAMLICAFSASADRLFFSPTIPDIQHLKGDLLPGGLRLNKPIEPQPRESIHPSRASSDAFRPVVNLSCPAPLRNMSFPLVPLLGEAGQKGDWVLFAGLRWEKDGGASSKNQALIETENGEGLTSWYYTVEMLFIPKDHWSIRASLAFDSSDIHDAFVVSPQKLNPLQFGVAISFEYDNKKPMVLDLGFGRFPLEGSVPAIQSGAAELYQVKPGEAASEAYLVSACLNIQF